jgi:hypothetical protein
VTGAGERKGDRSKLWLRSLIAEDRHVTPAGHVVATAIERCAEPHWV